MAGVPPPPGQEPPAGSIPEARLVDLTGEGVGVYREPRAGVYAHVQWTVGGDKLTPVRLPQVALAVTDILGA